MPGGQKANQILATQDDERTQLENVLAGKAKPTLSRPATLGHLAELYLKTPQSPGLAEKAFQLTQEALGLVTADSPLYPKLRHFHAMAMRWKTMDVAGIRNEAATIDREAWTLSYTKATREAILLAMEWADWAWERELWDEASEAYSLAHRALRKVALSQIDQSDRLEQLRHFRFATRGAYAFAKLQKATDAIVLLERASDLLFSGDRQKSELMRLAQTRPDLRDQLTAALLSEALAQDKHGVDSLGNLSSEELAAQAEANRIALEIRKIDGFASFTLPSGWQAVQEAASRVPLLYVVPSDKGCACFFVRFVGGQKTNIQIMDFAITLADFVAAAEPFIDAEFGDAGGDKYETLVALLIWLGTRIMIYVKQQLHAMGNDDQPFAIIPFGFSTNLPLHAACFPRGNPPRLGFLFHPRSVSYAYSARNLVESQRRSSEPPASPALIVNNPKPLPSTFDSLELSDAEAAAVAAHFSAKELSGFQATLSAVCDALPDAKVVHCTCHGSVDSSIAYSGVLMLGNGELSYQHLQQLPRFSARLVALSACRSGASAITVEHVINLPGAFLAVGAAAVLGALWHSSEIASLLLIEKFYEFWTDGTHSPVQALGDAQAWLMSSTADTLRASVKSEVLQHDAAKILTDAPGNVPIFSHPWYWSGFFLAGA